MPLEKTNPTLLKKYIYEYSLITLAGCVVFLFFQLADMNKFIRVNLIEQKSEVIRANEKTNAAIDRNTEAIKEFNQMYRQYEKNIYLDKEPFQKYKGDGRTIRKTVDTNR